MAKDIDTLEDTTAKQVEDLTTDVKDVHEKLMRGHEELKGALSEREAEIGKLGQADVLLTEKLDNIVKDLSGFADQVDAVRKTAEGLQVAINRSGLTMDPEEKDTRKAAILFGKRKAASRGTPFDEADVDVAAYQAYTKAYDKFIRRDERTLSPDDVRAMSIGSDPDGGYYVPEERSNRIVERIFETSPMRTVATVETIGSMSMIVPIDWDEAGSGWLGETETPVETTTPQTRQIEITAHTAYAEPRATQELLDDAVINIEDWLGRKVADRISRLENTAFIGGSGSGQPRGITAYDSGTSFNQIQQVNSGANGNVTHAGLVAALYALKAPHMARATWLAGRAVTQLFMLLADDNGRPIWAPNLQVGQPASLLGRPIVMMEDFADVGTGSLSAAVGDIGEAYTIVDRVGIRVLRDPFTAKPFIKFYTTRRTGGAVVNFEAIKLLALAT